MGTLRKTGDYAKRADHCVIYYSKKDMCWIAHSLYTDQVGTGEDIRDALAELISAIRSLIAIYIKCKDIRLWRDAPQETFKLEKKSKPLREDIYREAIEIALGHQLNQLSQGVISTRSIWRATLSKAIAA
jgi:hypothetical protein